MPPRNAGGNKGGGSLKSRLKAMQDRWLEGKDTPPGVPEGTYELRLQSATLGESKQSGNVRIEREHLVLDGEYSGEVIKDMLQLETEMGPFFVAQWIEQMGFDVPEDITEIEELLAQMVQEPLGYTANVKRNGNFTNVNINDVYELTDEGEGGEGGEVGEAGADDGLDELDRKALKAYINDNELDVTVSSKMSDDDVREAIREALASSGEAGEGEGGEVVEGDETRDSLAAFCESMEVEIGEDDSTEQILEVLRGFEWDPEQLTAEEVQLLTEVGILAEKPAPKPAPARRPTPKPAPAPAKPAAAPAKPKPAPAKPKAAARRK